MIKFTLDYNLVDPALNWKDINFTIKTDKQYSLYLQYQEYDLEFSGSGFDYIISKINSDSFCEQIVCEIFSTCETDYLIFSGIIFLNDCEVNERACTVKCKVSDRSFFAMVNNNKNIKTALNSGKTKNGEDIPNVVNFDLDVHSVNGDVYKYTINACRVYEAFKYMISFVSDNKLDFVSDTFYNGIYKELCITHGYRMRNASSSSFDFEWPQFSFIELFDEINKRIPLVLTIDDPYGIIGKPTVRIETLDYKYNAENIYQAYNIDEIVTSYDNDKLFAKVKFGGPIDTTYIYRFPEQITFFGFYQEEFHLLGTCNLDLTLDLTANWIVSSNIIENLVELGNQGYDDNIILIDTEGIGGVWSELAGRTTNTNFINLFPPYYYYNERLSNKAIADRYGNDWSGALTSYYASSTLGQCFVDTTIGLNNFANPNVPDTFNLIPFNNEVFDFGNYFDNTLYRYNALETASYYVSSQVQFSHTSWNGTGQGLHSVLLYHKDSTGTIKNIYPMDTTGNGGTYTSSGISLVGGAHPWYGKAILLPGSTVMFNAYLAPIVIQMVEGDYLEVEKNYWPYTVGPGSAPPYAPGQFLGSQKSYVNTDNNATYFKVFQTTIRGGTYTNPNINDIKIKKHSFTYPMTEAEWIQILNKPIGNIKFAMKDQQIRTGWIQEIKYSPIMGIAEFVLNTSNSTQYGI